MKIHPVANNYYQNSAKFLTQKVSFGEIDGDFYDYSPRRISKEEYAVKKDIINKKYDNMRSSWLNDCEDLEINNSEVWNELNKIEKRREMDLVELSRDYEV